jgi:hypothetical protein
VANTSTTLFSDSKNSSSFDGFAGRIIEALITAVELLITLAYVAAIINYLSL